MNARAEMPDWQMIADMLNGYATAIFRMPSSQLEDYHILHSVDDQLFKLRAWLAAQPLAPEDGGKDGGGECPDCGRIYTDYVVQAGLNVPCGKTPPASAREAVAWPHDFSANEWAAWLRDRGHMFGPYQRDVFEALASWIERHPVLFDHPAAGAVVVDEAAIERAGAAYQASNKNGLSDRMRAALTAAIGGAG